MNAYRDENYVPTKLGILTTDGVTPMRLYVSPTTGALHVKTVGSETYLGGSVAKRDDNNVPVMTGVSSSDGKTPVMLSITAAHELLVKSV